MIFGDNKTKMYNYLVSGEQALKSNNEQNNGTLVFSKEAF